MDLGWQRSYAASDKNLHLFKILKLDFWIGPHSTKTHHQGNKVVTDGTMLSEPAVCRTQQISSLNNIYKRWCGNLLFNHRKTSACAYKYFFSDSRCDINLKSLDQIVISHLFFFYSVSSCYSIFFNKK